MNTLMSEHKERISCLILAGGQGSRMRNADKGLVPLYGIPMVQHVIDCMRPQVKTIIINANRNLETYASYQYRIVTDTYTLNQGPLAGFAAGLECAKTPYIVTVPCDCPFIPANLVEDLFTALQQEKTDLAVVELEQRLQPVFSLMKIDVLDSLKQFIRHGGRKIDLWYRNIRYSRVDFSAQAKDFYNINRFRQIKMLEKDKDNRLWIRLQ